MQRKGSILAILFGLILFGLMWALVACAPQAAPTPTPTKAPAAAPTKPPAAKPPIKIGLIQSLTGTMANIARDNQDGFDLYMEKIGWTVAGRKIEKVVEDDEAKADVGLTKVRKLVENDKVHLIAGLHNTATCNAIAPYVRDNKMPTVVTGNCGSEALTKDPALRSPYVWRTTHASGMAGFALADWLAKNGYKKVVLIINDFMGGLEPADGFARAFIEEGGTIVQELYPALGTTDFGPFLAQLKPGADATVAMIIGADGLRFGQQYTEYGWKAKLPLFDLFAAIVAGPNLAELKDVAVGVIASDTYTTDSDTPEFKEFLAAWRAKYSGRLLSRDVVAGYAGAQILEAAIKGVDGNVEDKDKFLAALKKVEMRTPKGPFKFDDYQNPIENIYIKRIDKVGNEYVEKTLATVPNVSQFWKFKPEEVIKFPFTKLKGKWTNMTKDQLREVLKPYFQ